MADVLMRFSSPVLNSSLSSSQNLLLRHSRSTCLVLAFAGSMVQIDPTLYLAFSRDVRFPHYAAARLAIGNPQVVSAPGPAMSADAQEHRHRPLFDPISVAGADRGFQFAVVCGM